MVTHRSISPSGRANVSVSPPSRRHEAQQRLEEENQSLRRKINELELEKHLGDEIALRLFQAQDTPLLPPVATKPIQNPPSTGLQQKATWDTGPLLGTQPAQTAAKRGVILDQMSTVTFLDLSKGHMTKTRKAEPKTGALYKSAASAAERSRSHMEGAPLGRKVDTASNDYRIRFAQHDKNTLLQQRAHETFKLLNGGGTSASATIGAHSYANSFNTVAGARSDLMSTAARTPRARLSTSHSLTETHGRDPKEPRDDTRMRKCDHRFGRKRLVRQAAGIVKVCAPTRARALPMRPDSHAWLRNAGPRRPDLIIIAQI